MFKRIYKSPRRFSHAKKFDQLAKATYYYQRSRDRFEQRADAFTAESILLTGTIGTINGFSLYTKGEIHNESHP